MIRFACFICFVDFKWVSTLVSNSDAKVLYLTGAGYKGCFAELKKSFNVTFLLDIERLFLVSLLIYLSLMLQGNTPNSSLKHLVKYDGAVKPT